ncbi:MAG: efflux RND transporter periplasmic adaptor subunit [Clostridia bacterium]|nr:MAG: efflux RND transporter periplasmic adaptor subunit [Clostridia bacterium]
MRRLWVWVAAVVAVLAVAGLWLGWLPAPGWLPGPWPAGRTETAGGRLATVRVQRGDLSVTVTGTGTLEPATAEDIMAEAAGTVGQILVKKGDKVRAGQVVARLENEGQTLDLEAQKLNLEMRQQELADMEKDLTQMQVVIPQSGKLQELRVGSGDQVNKGMMVATIADPAHLELVAPVNVAQRQDLAVGQEAEVFLPDFLSSVSGRVTKISGAPRGGETGGALYDVTVELANPGALRPGMAARPTFITPAGRWQAVAEGQLAEKEPVEVKAPVAGEVRHVFFAQGDMVSAGAKLLDLANDSLSSQIESKKLQIRQAEITVAAKEADLPKMVIASPISGEVTEVAAAPGDEVRVGSPVAKVADYTRLEAVVPVDELDIAKVHPGQEVEVTTDAVPGRKFPGRVTEIATEGTAQGGVTSFDVRVALDSQEGLRPGMTITASILVATRTNVLLLPLEAVQETRGQTVVMLAQDGGQPRPVPVKLGLADVRFVEVLNGLEEGQEVLLPLPAGGTGNNFSGGFRIPGMPGGGFPSPQGSRSPAGGSSSQTSGSDRTPAATQRSSGSQGGGDSR